MRNRLLAGLFSIGLILLVVIGPIYLAEKLEKANSTNGGLTAYSSILTNSTSSTVYTPYLEMSNDTKTSYYASSTLFDDGIIWYDGGMTESPTYGYNYDGYWDYTLYGSSVPDPCYVYFFMECSASELLSDGANQLHIGVDSSEDYRINQIYFRGLNADYSSGAQISPNFPSEWSTTIETGSISYDYTLSSTDLNNAASTQSGYDEHALMIMFRFPNGYDGGYFITDIQISTDYYETQETTFNNQTVTSYVPSIQTVNSYIVHKALMVIGGILIMGIGWIASPWGENLDGLLPINNHQKKRGGKN